jgi:subtilase family serine protease
VSDATGLVRWIVDDPDVATIDGGRVVGAGLGVTTVRAQWDDLVSNPVPVTVVGSAAADLRVSSLTTWASGEDVTVPVTVENTGSAGASAFWVDAFLDPNREPVPGDLGEDWDSIAYVGPGDTKTVSLSIAGVGEGSHVVSVLVDSMDDVDEDDEGDNVDEAVVDVDGAELPADIVVDEFSWLGDGTDVYYWIEISNYGDEPTGAFYVDLYLDRTWAPEPGDEGDYFFDVPSIGPWETIAMEALVELDCVGCWSWVQADSMDEIDESYEYDNVEGPLVVTN